MRNFYVFKIVGSPFRAADRLLRFGVVPMNPYEYQYVRKQKGRSQSRLIGIGHNNPPPDIVLEAVPQLPGYFCGMFDASKFWAIRNACFDDGSRVLGSPLSPDGHVRPLAYDVYRSIMDLNSYAEEAPVIVPQRGLKPGDTVILKSGPHAGKRFRLQSTSNNGAKARIIMDFLGGLREVEIKADAVDVAQVAA
jgi:hypothetical protein